MYVPLSRALARALSRARVSDRPRRSKGPRLNWTARARPPSDAPRTDRGGDTASSTARAVSRERAEEGVQTGEKSLCRRSRRVAS